MKYCLIIVVIALTSIAANAQSRFKTNESIASQIKNGTAPNLLFSKQVPVKRVQLAEPVNRESLGKQIRSNTLPGMLYQRTAPAAKPDAELNMLSTPDVPSADNQAVESQKSDGKPASSEGVQYR